MWKRLKQILKWTLGLMAALAVFLVLSVVIDRGLSGGRLEAVTNLNLPNPNGPAIRAFIARPAGPGPHPAVIMIHEFWGINGEIQGKAAALAEEGYVVIAPDLFRGTTTGWLPSAIYQTVSTKPEQVLSDLDAVFAWLAAQGEVQPNRIAILGFCFGGRTSLRYSLSNPQIAATVVLYGSPVTDAEQLKALSGPVLGIFGGADNSISLESVRAFDAALTEAAVPHQISIYEGQPHAFVKSIEEIRLGGPMAEAWDEVLAFLQHALKGEATAHQPTKPLHLVERVDWAYWLKVAYEHAVGALAHAH
jgi:carboxymethylenebutenolidase